MDKDSLLASGYLMALGAVTALVGLMEIILDLSGSSFETSLVVMGEEAGDFMLWRGLILLTGGAMIVSGAMGLEHLKGLGKALLGTMMVWIVGLVNLFALVTGAVLADEESTGLFVTTLGDLLDGLAGPYVPAILLLPLTLPVAYLAIREWRSDPDMEEAVSPADETRAA